MSHVHSGPLFVKGLVTECAFMVELCFAAMPLSGVVDQASTHTHTTQLPSHPATLVLSSVQWGTQSVIHVSSTTGKLQTGQTGTRFWHPLSPPSSLFIQEPQVFYCWYVDVKAVYFTTHQNTTLVSPNKG